jgi:hypothetical protein
MVKECININIHELLNLLHLANHIRPQIAYAIRRLDRFTHNPNASH